jgi:hypothetical protein
MATTEIQALDAALTDAIQAARAKGVDAHHILHLHGRGETAQVQWEARQCGAEAEVAEMVRAFERLWRAVNEPVQAELGV